MEKKIMYFEYFIEWKVCLVTKQEVFCTQSIRVRKITFWHYGLCPATLMLICKAIDVFVTTPRSINERQNVPWRQSGNKTCLSRGPIIGSLVTIKEKYPWCFVFIKLQCSKVVLLNLSGLTRKLFDSCSNYFLNLFLYAGFQDVSNWRTAMDWIW